LIAKASKIYYIHEPLYFYLRNRVGSIVNDFNSLKDMILSLYELKENFSKCGLYEHYYPELRKMFFAQVRFILKRLENYMSINSLQAECKRIVNELNEFLNNECVELKAFDEFKFGILANPDIKISLQNIVFYEQQIVDLVMTDEVVDYLIITEKELDNKFKVPRKKTILISNERKLLTKDINLIVFDMGKKKNKNFYWDLSDEIFYAL